MPTASTDTDRTGCTLLTPMLHLHAGNRSAAPSAIHPEYRRLALTAMPAWQTGIGRACRPLGQPDEAHRPSLSGKTTRIHLAGRYSRQLITITPAARTTKQAKRAHRGSSIMSSSYPAPVGPQHHRRPRDAYATPPSIHFQSAMARRVPASIASGPGDAGIRTLRAISPDDIASDNSITAPPCWSARRRPSMLIDFQFTSSPRSRRHHRHRGPGSWPRPFSAVTGSTLLCSTLYAGVTLRQTGRRTVTASPSAAEMTASTPRRLSSPQSPRRQIIAVAPHRWHHP